MGAYLEAWQEGSGDVGFSQFKEKFVSDWSGRAIVAIPLALIAGVVKTVYHLGVAVLGLMTCDGKQISRGALSFTRDLEEAIGWMITPVWESYGQYLVQESAFYKAIYASGQVPARVKKEEKVPLAAEQYIEQGELSKALKATESYFPFDDRRFNLVVKIAGSFLERGELESAAHAISTIYADTTTAPVYKQIALAYLERGDEEKATDAIKKITDESERAALFKTRNEKLVQKMNKLSADDVKHAISAYGDYEIKVFLTEYFGERLVLEGNLEEALEWGKTQLRNDKALKAKVAQGYIDRKELMKAFALASTEYKPKLFDPIYQNLALAYLEMGDEESANKAIWRIESAVLRDELSKKREELFLKRAEAFSEELLNKAIEESDGERKSRLIEMLVDLYIRENRLKETRGIALFLDADREKALKVKVATAYIKNGDIEEGVRAASLIRDQAAVDSINEMAALAYLGKIEKDWEEKAIKCAKHIEDEKKKKSLFEKIVEPHFEKGDIEKCRQILYYYKDFRDAWLIQAANRYLNLGIKEKAVEAIEHVHTTNVQLAIYIKVQEAYVAEGKAQEALQVIAKMSDSEKHKRTLMAAEAFIEKRDYDNAHLFARSRNLFGEPTEILKKIAKGYLEAKEVKKAHELIIRGSLPLNKSLPIQLVRLYQTLNDKEGILKVLPAMIENELWDIMIKLNVVEKNMDLVERTALLKLSTESYEEIMKRIDNEEAVIGYIQEIGKAAILKKS